VSGAVGLSGEKQIDVDLIHANPNQPRKGLTAESLTDLVQSIRDVGILQPLLVARNEGRYVLVAGQRRLEAAKGAQLKTVPCRVMDLDEKQRLNYSLIENLQREDLTPLEEAESIQSLKELTRTDIREAARLIGKSKSFVCDRLALLTLPQDLKQAVETGGLPLKKAMELKRVPDAKQRARLTARAPSLDLDSLKALVDAVGVPRPKGRKPPDRWNTLPGLRDFAHNTEGVRLYRDRISLQFDSSETLMNLLTQMLALLSEA
jgi:ParB family chromosome partitioning protein